MHVQDHIDPSRYLVPDEFASVRFAKSRFSTGRMCGSWPRPSPIAVTHGTLRSSSSTAITHRYVHHLACTDGALSEDSHATDRVQILREIFPCEGLREHHMIDLERVCAQCRGMRTTIKGFFSFSFRSRPPVLEGPGLDSDLVSQYMVIEWP